MVVPALNVSEAGRLRTGTSAESGGGTGMVHRQKGARLRSSDGRTRRGDRAAFMTMLQAHLALFAGAYVAGALGPDTECRPASICEEPEGAT